MNEVSWLHRLLMEPKTKNIDMDSPDRLRVHREILNDKPVIKNVFYDFHREIYALDKKYFSDVNGTRVELGAGVCPIKESYPEVLSSDVVQSDGLDLVLDAQNMDLPDNSVRAIYGQNCFHHFPDPAQFFKELQRVLAPGGGAILIEPYYGPLASVLFKHLFSSEGFSKTETSWKADINGPMQGANQALSYIVFKRDYARFLSEFDQLEVVYDKPLTNYIRYFLSGGLNFKSLIPGFMEKPVCMLEYLLSPLSRLLALHHVIVIKRKR